LGNPGQTVKDLLAELGTALPAENILGIRVTGSGGRLAAAELNATAENEFKAIACSIGRLYPEVRTVFEIGGESSKYLRLAESGDTPQATGSDAHTYATGIADYSTSGECAAVLHGIYLRTSGRPIEVVQEGCRKSMAYSGNASWCGVGTTGSGRELIGELVGADTVNDEITAHKTGAVFVHFLRILEQPGLDPKKTALFLPTGQGPCRFGQYGPYLKSVLKGLGYGEITIFQPGCEHGYSDFGEASTLFVRGAWRAIVSADILLKLLLKSRPYEVVGLRRCGFRTERSGTLPGARGGLPGQQFADAGARGMPATRPQTIPRIAGAIGCN
jgi:hypothetical protein